MNDASGGYVKESHSVDAADSHAQYSMMYQQQCSAFVLSHTTSCKK